MSSLTVIYNLNLLSDFVLHLHGGIILAFSVRTRIFVPFFQTEPGRQSPRPAFYVFHIAVRHCGETTERIECTSETRPHFRSRKSQKKLTNEQNVTAESFIFSLYNLQTLEWGRSGNLESSVQHLRVFETETHPSSQQSEA